MLLLRFMFVRSPFWVSTASARRMRSRSTASFITALSSELRHVTESCAERPYRRATPPSMRAIAVEKVALGQSDVARFAESSLRLCATGLRVGATQRKRARADAKRGVGVIQHRVAPSFTAWRHSRNVHRRESPSDRGGDEAVTCVRSRHAGASRVTVGPDRHATMNFTATWRRRRVREETMFGEAGMDGARPFGTATRPRSRRSRAT